MNPDDTVEERVEKLIEVARGGPTPRYRWFKRYVMGIKWEYNIGEALQAVELLGCTRSQRALDYLRPLLSQKKYTASPLTKSSESMRCLVTFPDAGRLSDKLYLMVIDEDTLENVENYARELANSPDLKVKSSTTARVVVSRTYRTLYDAIKRLEAACSLE